MSQQNPTIPTATQAKGIDAAVNDLQTALSFDLSWLTNGMGRAYRRNKTRSNGASAFLPMVYLGTNFANDFFNATPDNDKEGQSIILVGDATHTDFKTGFYGWLEYPISIIFSANLDTIDSALLATEDFTEHLMEDVRDSIRNLLGKSYRVAIDSETREFESVYSEFDISVGNTSKPLLPMTYFRFECTLTVKEDCGNNTLNRCTAILQNLTSTDLNECILPTYDFSDTTVQANVTAQQRSDLTDWLCGPLLAVSSLNFNSINEVIIYDSPNVALEPQKDDPFSGGCWIKPRNPSTGTIMANINTSTNQGWSFFLKPTGVMQFILSEQYIGGRWISVFSSSDVMTAHTEDWVHVGFTKDSTGLGSGVKLYVNGVSVATTVASDLTTTITYNTNTSIAGNNDISYIFDGVIFNSRIWSREITAAEMLSEAGNTDQQITTVPNLVINPNFTDAVYVESPYSFTVPDTESGDNLAGSNMDNSNKVLDIP